MCAPSQASSPTCANRDVAHEHLRDQGEVAAAAPAAGRGGASLLCGETDLGFSPHLSSAKSEATRILDLNHMIT